MYNIFFLSSKLTKMLIPWHPLRDIDGISVTLEEFVYDCNIVTNDEIFSNLMNYSATIAGSRKIVIVIEFLVSFCRDPIG